MLRTPTSAASRSSSPVLVSRPSPGMVASLDPLPVIGVPVPSRHPGLDSLYSIVQMPAGIPVATVASATPKRWVVSSANPRNPTRITRASATVSPNSSPIRDGEAIKVRADGDPALLRRTLVNNTTRLFSAYFLTFTAVARNQVVFLLFSCISSTLRKYSTI